MDMKNIGAQPDLNGLNQLEAAVLMEKYTLLLGMINFGTSEQKQQAREELKELEGLIYNHIDGVAFVTANNNLGLTEDELELIDQPLR